METKFNLRHAVNQYVSSIYNQGSLTPADVQELEAHLLDTVEALCSQGLNEEEAFLIAKRRLGTQELLSTEYAKVNPAVQTNQVWAYMLTGFNLLFGLVAFSRLANQAFLIYLVKRPIQESTAQTILITAYLSYTVLLLFLVSKKDHLSRLVDAGVKKNTLKTVLLTCLIPVIWMYLNQFVDKYTFDNGIKALMSPKSFKDNPTVFLSYFVSRFSFCIVFLGLIFILRKSQRFSLKAFFERPPILFLIALGYSTIQLLVSILVQASPGFYLSFGIILSVYMIGAMLISYYNQSKELVYLAWFSLFGASLIIGPQLFLMIQSYRNPSVNIPVDYHFIYGLCAILLGLTAGYIIGKLLQRLSSKWKMDLV